AAALPLAFGWIGAKAAMVDEAIGLDLAADLELEHGDVGHDLLVDGRDLDELARLGCGGRADRSVVRARATGALVGGELGRELVVVRPDLAPLLRHDLELDGQRRRAGRLGRRAQLRVEQLVLGGLERLRRAVELALLTAGE